MPPLVSSTTISDPVCFKAVSTNFRFHDLRHTSASIMAKTDSLLELADHLGHKTMAMVRSAMPTYVQGTRLCSRKHVRESDTGGSEMSPVNFDYRCGILEAADPVA